MDSVVRLPTPRTRHQAWLQRWRRLWQLLVAKASGFCVVVSVQRCARLVLVGPKGSWCGLGLGFSFGFGLGKVGGLGVGGARCSTRWGVRLWMRARYAAAVYKWVRMSQMLVLPHLRGGGSCPFWFRSCWRRHGRSMSTGGPSRYAPCMSSPAVCGPGMGSMRGGAITVAACGCPVSKISIEVLLFLFARSAGGIQK